MIDARVVLTTRGGPVWSLPSQYSYWRIHFPIKIAWSATALLLACTSSNGRAPSKSGSASPAIVVPLQVAPQIDAADAAPIGLEQFPDQPNINAATRALLPIDGVMFASRTMRSDNNVLLLYQLMPNGLREVFRQPNTQVTAMGWLNRQTLVLYGENPTDGDATLQLMVNGTPRPVVVVPFATWKLAAFVGTGTLHLYGNGEIWVQRCARHADIENADSPCLATAALRIDQPPPYFARNKRPATGELARRAIDVHHSWFQFDASLAPTVSAPPAHKLAMFTVRGAKRSNYIVSYDNGWRCSRPAVVDASEGESDEAARFEWPYGSEWIEQGNIPTFRPSLVRWVSATPPRYVVEGIATNMVGESWPLTALFHACERYPVNAAAYLGSNIWAEMNELRASSNDPTIAPLIHGEWHLFVGATEVGVAFGGDGIAVQPQL